MASVSFTLNRPTDDKGNLKDRPVPILVSYYNEGVAVQNLSTKEKCKPAQWAGTRVTKSAPRAGKINKRLSDLENALLNIIHDHPGINRDQEATIARAVIRGEKILTPEEKKTIFPWIDTYIGTARIKDSTRQVLRATRDHLKNFNPDLTWGDLDLKFYQDFTEYLYKLGHSDNTVGKYIKKTKQFMRESFEDDQHQNLSYNKRRFKSPTAKTEEVHLTPDELEKMHRTDMGTLNPLKERLIFNCWVGLRFADVGKLRPENEVQTLTGPGLKVFTSKTKEWVVIPLHPTALEIWRSWGGIPPKISNPKFNKAIKKIAEIAGLNQKVEKHRTVKGETTIEWVPKHKMVKAHTCRRSFATNMVKKGIPVYTIMAVTGHKTEKEFWKYVGIKNQESAEIMGEYLKNEKPLMRKRA